MQSKGNKQNECISRHVKLFKKCSTQGTRRIAMVKEACIVRVQTQKQNTFCVRNTPGEYNSAEAFT